jgi:hypothetical protein
LASVVAILSFKRLIDFCEVCDVISEEVSDVFGRKWGEFSLEDAGGFDGVVFSLLGIATLREEEFSRVLVGSWGVFSSEAKRK